MMMARLAVLAGCVVSLVGCDFAPAYAPPVIAIPAAYKEAGPWHYAEPADDVPRGPWWEAYGDLQLNALEEQVNISNITLVAEVAIYDQARAYALEAESGLYPSIGTGGSLTTNKQSMHRPLRPARHESNYFGNNTLDAQANFEIDVWGRIRDFANAGKNIAQATAADLETLRLSLHAELASDYVALRGLDQDIKLLSDTVVAYQKALTLVQNRFSGDIASGVDVAQAETQLSSAKALVSDYQSRRSLLEHAIAVLIGQMPANFSIAESAAPLALPGTPSVVPSTLLQRRPDIASAERRTAASNQLIGVAEAAFYPRFSLSALGGFQDTALNLLSLPNSFWAVGPAFALPLFEGGLRHAELAGAKAAFEQSSAEYRQTVLEAFQEVEDNLALLHWLAQSSKDQDAAAVAADRSVTLALTLYRDGAENYLQVVIAQTEALSAERAALSYHTRLLQASVGLVKALGGGWDVAELPPMKAF